MTDMPLSSPSDTVIDLAQSPFAKLKPVPLSAVQLKDRFWSPRITISRDITLPSQLAHCEATGRIDNFRRASGKNPDLPFQGIYQNPLADQGKHRRQEWFGCACCPPNLARMLASLSGYFCSISERGVCLHLYAAGSITIPFENGEELQMNVKTDLLNRPLARVRYKNVPA